MANAARTGSGKTRSAPQRCARHLDFQQRASLLTSSIGTSGTASGQLLEQALLRLYMMMASSTSFQIRTSVKAGVTFSGCQELGRCYAGEVNSKIPSTFAPASAKTVKISGFGTDAG